MADSSSNRPAQDLVVDELVKTYPGGVIAADHVSLKIEEGQFATLLGPSGCGKTTTLNCIAGLESPDAGRITVGATVLTDVARRVNLSPERRNLGMVFQSYALWPHMTVYDNLAFGLRLKRVSGDVVRSRIGEALELVGLAGMERRYPFQLSGGQQQRVALARAVVAQPRVLLLDEPLSNLDAKVREQARFWLREFQQRLGITTVYVTHDQGEALAISDMVAVMSAGRVLQYAHPKEIYERPASRFVADFIGQTSFLPASVVASDAGSMRGRLASGEELTAETDGSWRPGDRVLLAVHSERIEFLGSDGGLAPNPTLPAQGGAGNVVVGTIRSFVYVGTAYEYLVDTPNGPLRAASPDPVAGRDVRLYCPPDSIVVLADEPEPANAPTEPGSASGPREPIVVTAAP